MRIQYYRCLKGERKIKNLQLKLQFGTRERFILETLEKQFSRARIQN